MAGPRAALPHNHGSAHCLFDQAGLPTIQNINYTNYCPDKICTIPDPTRHSSVMGIMTFQHRCIS